MHLRPSLHIFLQSMFLIHKQQHYKYKFYMFLFCSQIQFIPTQQLLYIIKHNFSFFNSFTHSQYVIITVTLRITLKRRWEGAKWTAGIGIFNLRRSQVRKRGKIGFNQSLICVQHSPRLSPQLFIYPF